MEELSIEQKAKAYDEAIAHAKKLLKTIGDATLGNLVLKNEFKIMFPELEKNEDEKIKKHLITFFEREYGKSSNSRFAGIKVKDVISWLEKQGGQNPPPDKAEPKFKVGDWCIDNEDGTIFQIVKVLDNTYTYKTNDGKEYSCTHYSLENDATEVRVLSSLYNDLKKLREE